MENIEEKVRRPRTIIVEIDTIGSLFRGLFYGALLGAGIALLSTPNNGEKNRTFVSQKSSDLMERAQVLADEARERAQIIAEEARLRAQRVVASARGMDASSGNGDTTQELKTENEIMETENRKTYDL